MDSIVRDLGRHEVRVWGCSARAQGAPPENLGGWAGAPDATARPGVPEARERPAVAVAVAGGRGGVGPGAPRPGSVGGGEEGERGCG